MSRYLTTHHVNPCNQGITIEAKGVETAGKGEKAYWLRYGEGELAGLVALVFHDGDPMQGVNGITHEALIAVLIDRLEGFQQGPYAYLHNNLALELLRSVALVLKMRTQERMNPGVEGTHEV